MLIKVKYHQASSYHRYFSFNEIMDYNKVICIDCSNSMICKLPFLPENLQELYCQNNALKFIPELPYTLKILNCDNNPLIKYPKLPKGLNTLIFNKQPTLQYYKPQPHPQNQLNEIKEYKQPNIEIFSSPPSVIIEPLSNIINMAEITEINAHEIKKKPSLLKRFKHAIKTFFKN